VVSHTPSTVGLRIKRRALHPIHVLSVATINSVVVVLQL
jgi:hypothetical protein